MTMVMAGGQLVVNIALKGGTSIAAICMAAWPRIWPSWPVLRIPPGAPPASRNCDSWRRYCLSCATSGSANLRVRRAAAVLMISHLVRALDCMASEDVEMFVRRLLAVCDVANVLATFPVNIVRASVDGHCSFDEIEAAVLSGARERLVRAGCSHGLADAGRFTMWPVTATNDTERVYSHG